MHFKLIIWPTHRLIETTAHRNPGHRRRVWR